MVERNEGGYGVPIGTFHRSWIGYIGSSDGTGSVRKGWNEWNCSTKRNGLPEWISHLQRPVHFTMKNSTHNAQEYFDRLGEKERVALLKIRNLITGIWPGIRENMEFDMPSYHLRGYAFCALASQKNFMVFHIKPYDLLIPFRKDLLIYDRGLSCIRFRNLDEATLHLFDRIIKYTGSQLEESGKLKVTARNQRISTGIGK